VYDRRLAFTHLLPFSPANYIYRGVELEREDGFSTVWDNTGFGNNVAMAQLRMTQLLN
jgi:hypothetical protein